MANVKIEMNRGDGWEVRQEGDAPVTTDQLAEMLPGYALQYPHRAYFDGELVAAVTHSRGDRKAKVLRF